MANINKGKRKQAISKVNRQITIGFVLVTVILVLIIGYFSLSYATIYLTPEKYPINTTMELEILPEVSSTLTSSNILPGQILSSPASSTDSFTPSQTTTQTSKANGKVTIINNYSSNQPLIATTRLLTPDGILFRTTETVTVPAGGKLEVSVEADEVGKKYAIGPSKFTIPGLWEGLQDKIYATSDAPMTLENITIKTITPADLENAKQTLLKKIITSAKKDYGNSENYLIIKTEILSTNASNQVGDQAASFNFSVEANVIIIQFPIQGMHTIATNNLKLAVPDNQRYLSFNPDSLVYQLKRLDPDGDSATITVTISGLANADIESLFDKKEILGLAKPDVEKYFKELGGIETVQVNFSPAWVKSVPPLEDHVLIEIIK